MKSFGMHAFATAVTALFLAASLPACSDSNPASGSGGDLASGCADLCTSAGFPRNGFDMLNNEAKCFCLGGTGTVTEPACQGLCDSIDYPGAQPFAQNAGGDLDACQCTR